MLQLYSAAGLTGFYQSCSFIMCRRLHSGVVSILDTQRSVRNLQCWHFQFIRQVICHTDHFWPVHRKGTSQMDKQKVQLWSSLQLVVPIFHIVIPKQWDVGKSKANVQQFHALNTALFATGSSQSHFFTPSIHAILHLPQRLLDYGAIVNISNFALKQW